MNKPYGHTIKIGEKYEFCKIVNGISIVFYGTVIAVDGKTKTATFKENRTGEIHKGINTIRGVAFENYTTQEQKDS